MSRNLKKSNHYIYLLLDNNLNLNKHILTHAGRRNLQSLAEIFYNVFRLPLSNKTRNKFHKNIKILRKFIQSPANRDKIARRNYKVFSDLLRSIAKYLKIILK